MARTKTEQVALRLTPLEKEKLATQATTARMNMSQYLLALSEQKRIIVIDGVPELCKQIIKIGTNVNQIAMVANQNKSISVRQLDIVNENLIQIQNLISNLLDTVYDAKDEVKI